MNCIYQFTKRKQLFSGFNICATRDGRAWHECHVKSMKTAVHRTYIYIYTWSYMYTYNIYIYIYAPLIDRQATTQLTQHWLTHEYLHLHLPMLFYHNGDCYTACAYVPATQVTLHWL